VLGGKEGKDVCISLVYLLQPTLYLPGFDSTADTATATTTTTVATLSDKDREYCRNLAESTTNLPAMCYTDKESVNMVRRQTAGTKVDPWAGAKGGKQGVEGAKLMRRYTKTSQFKK
jgi:hypothetical protein